MALFRKFFYRKPPDGLLKISDRVYVFDCCFTTDTLEEDDYKVYMGGIVCQLRDYFPNSSFMVFNFREGERQSSIGNMLSEYDMTVMDYPRHYEGCPLLTMEMIHHFLRSSENWLALMQKNVLLMHCEEGGWPVLAFMLAALLIYRKNFTGEQKTLEMIYKQAPPELLKLMSPLNPVPSQLRYLQYVSRRNVGTEWPPLDRALTLDCVILRSIPNMDAEGGCRPIFRIYGQDPLMVADRSPKVLFSTPKRSKMIRHYKQGLCDLIKIDIHCHIQGDVVMECITVDSDLEQEQMIFRVMFNTAFIRSNILMVNCDEIDTLWNVKDRFPKDFRAEVLFSEMNSTSSPDTVELLGFEEKGGLPVEAFAKVQEIFSNVDWSDTRPDAAFNMLQHITTLKQNLECASPRRTDIARVQESPIEKVKYRSKLKDLELTNRNPASFSPWEQFMLSPTRAPSTNLIREKIEAQDPKTTEQDANSTLNSIQKKADSQDRQVALQRTAQSKIISPRVSKSLQPSPFNSTPSNLGISALLQDHATSNDKEAGLPPSAISSSSTNVQRPMQINQVSTLRPSQPEPASTFFSDKISAAVASPRLISTATDSSEISSDRSHLLKSSDLSITKSSSIPPSPSPPLPSFSGESPSVAERDELPAAAGKKELPSATDKKLFSAPPPPPPPCPPPPPSSKIVPGPPPPPPPILGRVSVASVLPPPPPPPPFPSSAQKGSSLDSPKQGPPAPPPPAPSLKGLSKPGGAPLSSGVGNGNVPPVPGPPSGGSFFAKGRSLLRSSPKSLGQAKKANLKPYHWLKLTRAMQGSLWAETQKSDETSKPPEFDMLELESLFSAAAPNTGSGGSPKSNRRKLKPDKVQLIELRRAYNCEIMLSKVKIPMSELMSSVLALDDSALDIDQVDNLIKFCPTKEEIELLKGYNGDKENLGKCEQFFSELMKVPRVESKLRVFSFKMQFHTQVSDLRKNLNVVNSAAEEIRSSAKLKKVMQTILSLGNALNHGTARGSAIGFRLDSLLKLTDTRARNNKMTLMHYLCKVLAEKLPELLDFAKDLRSLEAASKIQLKWLAEEMQAISKGLEKVMQELTASENDGQVSELFCSMLKSFLDSAESDVRSLALLYSSVGRNADALALYFGEDPVRCPFEQVVSTLLNFVRMFVRAHGENCKQLEYEKKMADNEKIKMNNASKKESENEKKMADNEKIKMNNASKKESEKLLQPPVKSGSVK
ncbi:formin-like protein 18 isoform X1 [Euphorbia lathyris]|uniref:formin-like protein 18 isoform X1 n=1 Tax=Euphorbia lathyris TaxID=212925 RepID=UPI0033138FD8